MRLRAGDHNVILRRKSIIRSITVTLWFNKRWIKNQMRRGNRIIDIGEPPGMPPSDFYDMERRLTNGYWNYFQDIQP